MREASKAFALAFIPVYLGACAPDGVITTPSPHEVTGRSCPRDGWGPLITPLYEHRTPATPPSGAPDVLPATPIHVVVLPTRSRPTRLLMFGQARGASACKAGVSAWVSWEMEAPENPPVYPLVTPIFEVKKKPLDSLVCAGHAFMPDGTLFAAGGTEFADPGQGLGLDYAQTYNATTRKFTKVEPDFRGLGQGAYDALITRESRRWYPTTTTMPDGKVLVTGGFENFTTDSFNLSIELYDSTARAPWRILAAQGDVPQGLVPFQYTHVWVLPDPQSTRKEVLMIGDPGELRFFSYTGAGTGASRFYRPVEWRRRDRVDGRGSPSVLLPFKEPSSAATRIPTRVMMGGGATDSHNRNLQSIDIYDAHSERWEARINTGIGRLNGAFVLLPDGNVMLVGGESPNPSLGDQTVPQLFDPDRRNLCWGTSHNQPLGTDPGARGYHNVAALLPDGRVVVGGGQRGGAGGCIIERRDMRYYRPPYLFRKEPRPKFVGNVPRCVEYGTRFRVSYDNDGRAIDRVVLLGYGTMTHSVNMGARYVELRTFGADAESVNVAAPRNGWVVPPGPYHLFIVRDFPGAHWANDRLPSRSELIYVARSCAEIAHRLAD